MRLSNVALHFFIDVFWGSVNTEWRRMKTDESTFYNSWRLEFLVPVWVNYQKFSSKKPPHLFSGKVMSGCAEIDLEDRQSLGLPTRKLGNPRDLLGSCTWHHLADSCHNVNRGPSNAIGVNRNTDWMRSQWKNITNIAITQQKMSDFKCIYFWRLGGIAGLCPKEQPEERDKCAM